MIRLTDILFEALLNEEDRCKRIADRRYDKPSAYKSGAIVRCRQGKIWKKLKEDESLRKWFSRKGAAGSEGEFNEIKNILTKLRNKVTHLIPK